jgi:electron-transferring-flavoprotein dehydrogenase
VVNIAKITGIHNAMKTGMLGAEGAFDALFPASGLLPSYQLVLFCLLFVRVGSAENSGEKAADLSNYTKAFTKSWVYEDLNEVRNLRPSFATRLGLWGGVAYSGIDSLFLRGKGWWTFRHTAEKDRLKYIVRRHSTR